MAKAIVKIPKDKSEKHKIVISKEVWQIVVAIIIIMFLLLVVQSVIK